MDYNKGSDGLDISGVSIRNFLRSKAFPATTRPMGSSLNKEWHEEYANFDMTGMMTDPARWIRSEKYNEKKEWRHSDFKDAPYVHVWKVFEKITTQGESK